MKKTPFRLLSSLLLVSMLLSACSGAATPQATATQTTAPAIAPRVKVVIFVGLGTGTDPDQIEAQNALAAEFNSTHDSIEVEFLIVPYEEAPERLVAMISGGNAPQLVGPNGVSTVAQYFDAWADITPFIQEENFDLSDFYGPAVSLNEYPDKNTGLPLGLYPSFIFYNKDMFDAAGVDYPTHDFADKSWTLDALRQMAMQLTLDKDGRSATDPDFDVGSIVQWGFDDSWIDGRGFLTKFGAENVGRPTTADYRTAVVNSPEWLYGAQWLSDALWVDHFVPDKVAQDAVTGEDPLGTGTTAMFYSHTWYMSEGLKDLPFEYDLAPLPYNQKGVRISRAHADNFTIPKNAEHQREAWEVMKWLTSAEHIVDVCIIYGCLPARKSVEAAYLERLKGKYPGIDYDVIFQSIDYLDNPHHESYVPEWGKVGEAIENGMSLIYTGTERDARKVLDGVNAEVQQILDEYWATH